MHGYALECRQDAEGVHRGLAALVVRAINRDNALSLFPRFQKLAAPA